MKILFLSHSAHFNGAEICLLTLVKHLDRNLFEPVVVLPARGPLYDDLARLGITTYLSPLEWWTDLEGSFHYSGTSLVERLGFLNQIIHKEAPDIIHSNTSVIWEGALAACSNNIPHIWHLHEILEGHPTLSPLLSTPLLYKLVSALSARVVTVSKEAASAVSPFIPDEKLTTIHNGIDPERIASGHQPFTREELGIVGDSRIAITVASLSRYKGHDVLLDAISLIRKKCPAIKFLLVGYGTESAIASLNENIRRLDLADKVTYLGFRSDVPRILAAADFFVLPSYKEALPLSILEAMALAKPVIATDAGGVSELVEDGVSGFVVPVGDAEALANRILDLAQNPEQIQSMGVRARQAFGERYSAEAYAARFQSLYSHVLRETPVPRSSPIPPLFLTAMIETYDRLLSRLSMLQGLYHALADKDATIAYKDSVIAAREERVRQMESSWSWRLTKPLRESRALEPIRRAFRSRPDR